MEAATPPQLVASLGGVALYAHDLATLEPGQWLNDAVLSFVGEHLMARQPPAIASVSGGARLGVVCLDALSGPLLLALDDDELAALASKLGLARAAAVLIPLSDVSSAAYSAASGSHWTLLAWAVRGGWAHFDSAPPARGGGANAHVAARLAQRLDSVLGGGGEIVVFAAACPRQLNDADCGAHVAWIMERLASSPAVVGAVAPYGGLKEETRAEYWLAALGHDVPAEMSAQRERIAEFARAHAV